MATTKKKRRPTKHRGNAAGMIETRGRTGRRPSEAERKSPAKMTAAERRQARLDTPPSWRSAINKAAIAAVVFAVAVTLLFKRPVLASLGLAVFTFFVYVPLSYYTDLFIYNRGQKQKRR